MNDHEEEKLRARARSGKGRKPNPRAMELVRNTRADGLLPSDGEARWMAVYESMERSKKCTES